MGFWKQMLTAVFTATVATTVAATVEPQEAQAHHYTANYNSVPQRRAYRKPVVRYNSRSNKVQIEKKWVQPKDPVVTNITSKHRKVAEDRVVNSYSRSSRLNYYRLQRNRRFYNGYNQPRIRRPSYQIKPRYVPMRKVNSTNVNYSTPYFGCIPRLQYDHRAGSYRQLNNCNNIVPTHNRIRRSENQIIQKQSTYGRY
ncbi:MAG: hypothetical protein AAGF07_02215 [Patescibacteria group bacterium]